MLCILCLSSHVKTSAFRRLTAAKRGGIHHLSELRNVLLDNLLDLSLDLGGDVASGDLLEEGGLLGSEVFTELGFPFGDLVDRDGVKLIGIAEIQRW